MKMKDFKAALESKLRYAEKNLKVEDDFLYGICFLYGRYSSVYQQ